MRIAPFLASFLLTFPRFLHAQSLDSIRKLEAAGDVGGARAALRRVAESRPNDGAALQSYAEFLERYNDPGSRALYARALPLLRQSNDLPNAAAAARRLAILDLEAGDRDGAGRDLETYRAITGKTLQLESSRTEEPRRFITIPGPLRSFARMAAMPPETAPDEILAALARNIVTNGYQASHSNEELEQTEYLKLVHRYIAEARELQALAGEREVIEVPACESPKGAELLRVLGYRMRGGCGSDVVLETVNATRAFVTADSGFPINELEQSLRTNRPFTFAYSRTKVPVLFGPEYWLGPPEKGKADPDFLDAFLADPAICRLYLGFSKLDSETSEALRKAAPVTRLRVYSHVLDFFGGMFEVRRGRAIVPGGDRSAAAWSELAGASPQQGGVFFDKLLSKDDGWLASLYDALARIHGPVRDYFTDPARMKRYYTALRGRITSPGPARPVFRSNTDLMLLTTRLRLDSNGKAHVPGNLEIWKALFTSSPQAKTDAKIQRLAATWKDSDDLVEALVALCRKMAENEPLKIFMALSDLDRNRPRPLEPQTVERLIRNYKIYGNQYAIFSESRELSDKSITQYLDTAEAISRMRDPEFRSDLAGIFDSLIGMWQIFVRQQSLPAAQADPMFSTLAASFAQIRNSRELFDAGRSGVKLLLGSVPRGQSTAKDNEPQERIIDLLAGASSSQDSEARDQVAQDIMRVLEAQRMVSLDTLFQLGDQLESVARGEKLNGSLVAKLSGRISEIQLPRASLSSAEKTSITFGYWVEKHIEEQRRMNLRAAVDKAANDPERLKDVRGLLTPILRDTLLAYNYAYYAPPGSQLLYTNPVFVRSHDFVGAQGANHLWRSTEVLGSGWPSSAGGRLVGSLSSLPYALAEAEQNFLVPAQTQALIWTDLVPQMILSAKIPRWWSVTPSQLHWVGLHLRYGRELLASSAFDSGLRTQVLEELSNLASPVRTHEIGALIEQAKVKEALDRATPSELFLLAREMAPKAEGTSSLAAEIRQLSQEAPDQINYEVISRAFGSPKPTLANSYEPELMNLRTFPTLMGYSSRIMAESWESNTLFWAALADELALRPAELNVRIPEWTGKLVEQIFASHLEDWPALLKSLRLVGEDVRAKSRAAAVIDQKAAL
ncbi:MAG: hypothetical protein JO323_06060 [Acidobacteriia bacterium]|nr:hypothetical protein [Terriglobia bacterium]